MCYYTIGPVRRDIEPEKEEYLIGPVWNERLVALAQDSAEKNPIGINRNLIFDPKH